MVAAALAASAAARPTQPTCVLRASAPSSKAPAALPFPIECNGDCHPDRSASTDGVFSCVWCLAGSGS
eukprot:5013017-Prymnesium_polylepis.1